MKPSWSEAPDWAMWLAQDSSGKWYWYEYEPKAISCLGIYNIGVGCHEVANCEYPDWEDSLEQRP